MGALELWVFGLLSNQGLFCGLLRSACGAVRPHNSPCPPAAPPLTRLSCDLEAAQLLLPLCRRLRHLDLDMQSSDYESVRGLCRAAARGLAAAPASLRTLRLRSGMRWLRERQLGRLQLTMWTLDVDWRSEWPTLAEAKHAEAVLAHVCEARLGAHEDGALSAAVPGAGALRALRRLHLEAEVGGRRVGEVSGYEPHCSFTRWPEDDRPACETQRLRAPWLAALPALQELDVMVEGSASIADVPDVWSLRRLTVLELAAACAAPPPPAALALPALRRLTLRCCFAGDAAGTLPEAFCSLASLTHLVGVVSHRGRCSGVLVAVLGGACLPPPLPCLIPLLIHTSAIPPGLPAGRAGAAGLGARPLPPAAAGVTAERPAGAGGCCGNVADLQCSSDACAAATGRRTKMAGRCPNPAAACPRPAPPTRASCSGCTTARPPAWTRAACARWGR